MSDIKNNRTVVAAWCSLADSLHLAASIYSRDNTIKFMEPSDVLHRWAEHFDEMFNPGSQCVDLSCIYSLERLPVVSNFGTPPCFEEFIRALNCLENAK